MLVLDAQRIVRYRGRVDDQYAIGVQRDKPQSRDLARALDELLAGKPVSTPTTDVVGCLIGRAKRPAADSAVTFAKDIAPIFNRRCVECHRPGEIGPFSLTEYSKAAGWAEMIAEVVDNGRMPPWHADPKYGHFANDRRLTADEKKLIRTWVDNGAPAGDLNESAAAARVHRRLADCPKRPMSSSTCGAVHTTCPAEGAVRYQYFVAPTGFTEDKWVSAMEVRPGNRAVVHHILVFARKIGDRGDPDGGGTRGFLASYVPGLRPKPFPAGMAKRIPARSILIFQVHYTPNGSKTDGPQQNRLRVRRPQNDHARGPHDQRRAAAESAFRPATPTTSSKPRPAPPPPARLLLGYMPHMHLRGKAFSYEAVYPDGKQRDAARRPALRFQLADRLPARRRR